MNGIPMLHDEAWWLLSVLVVICLLCLVLMLAYWTYIGIEKVLLYVENKRRADHRVVPAPLIKHHRANRLAKPKPAPSLSKPLTQY